MPIKRFYSLIFIILLWYSCIPSQKLSGERINQIRFGSGGGFTGEYTEYILDSSCSLSDQQEVISQLNKKDCKLLFEKATQLIDYSYSKPGNMSNYIEFDLADSVKRFSWAYGSSEVKTDLKELHQDLVKLTIK